MVDKEGGDFEAIFDNPKAIQETAESIKSLFTNNKSERVQIVDVIDDEEEIDDLESTDADTDVDVSDKDEEDTTDNQKTI